MNDLLSQEEIDALLKGVDDGGFEVDLNEFQDEGTAKTHDFRNQDRIIRRRIPTLEMINERFSKYLRSSLFKFLHRSPEIFLSGIQILKFSEYVRELRVPTNLNIIRFSPLRGRALIVLEPNLIFTTVDNFFGGGKHVYKTSLDAREFTPTETRVIQILMEMIFNDLQEAWSPVMALDFEYMSSEINPHFATIVGPDDIVVISRINIALEGGGGDINIVMPYAMIEPIRGLLEAIGDAGETVDNDWKTALRGEVMATEVTLYSRLVEKTLPIRDVLNLKKGDVIPIDMEKNVVLKVKGIPIFTGKACASEGYYAVRIIDKVDAESL
jgi:flagellar motor switch protein FliM